MKNTTDNSRQPNWSDRHLWQVKPLQDLFWIGFAVSILWFGYHIRGVMIPILIGAGLAYIVNPVLIMAEEKWDLPRPVPISVILISLSLAVIVSMLVVFPLILDEVHTLVKKTPNYLTTVSEKNDAKVDERFVEQIKKLGGQVPANPMELIKFTVSNLGNVLGIVGQIVSTTGYLVLVVCLVPIYFFFFAWYFGPIKRRAQKLIPVTHRERVLEIARKMDDVVGNFLRGRMLVVLAMVAMFSVGFWIAGVPYWFMLGTITGILSFVPYVAVVGWALAIGVTWVDVVSGGSGSFSWLAVFVWPTVAYCVVQLLEGWLITPWVQGKSMGMNPVVILIVVFIGGAVGGIYGLLLAVPVAGCARILCSEVLIPKLENWAADA